jgi:hypothetical protein
MDVTKVLIQRFVFASPTVLAGLGITFVKP